MFKGTEVQLKYMDLWSCMLHASCFWLSFIEYYNHSHSIDLNLNFISFLLMLCQYRRPFSIHKRKCLCRLWYTLHHEVYSIITLDMFHMLSLGFYSLVTPYWSPRWLQKNYFDSVFCLLGFRTYISLPLTTKVNIPYWPTCVMWNDEHGCTLKRNTTDWLEILTPKHRLSQSDTSLACFNQVHQQWTPG